MCLFLEGFVYSRGSHFGLGAKTHPSLFSLGCVRTFPLSILVILWFSLWMYCILAALSWTHEPSGVFSLKSAQNLIRSPNPRWDLAKLVWNKCNTPKASFCTWMAVNQKLKTIEFLYSRGIHVESKRCSLCNADIENTDHLFFRCGYSKWIWNNLLHKFGIRRCNLSLVEEANRLAKFFPNGSPFSKMLAITFSSTIWRIWSERNERRFNGGKNYKIIRLKKVIRDFQWRINTMI